MGEHFDEDVVFPRIAEAIDMICEVGGVDCADRDQIVFSSWLPFASA